MVVGAIIDLGNNKKINGEFMSNNEKKIATGKLVRVIGEKISIAIIKKITGVDAIEDIYEIITGEVKEVYDSLNKDKIYNFYMGLDELSEDDVNFDKADFSYIVKRLLLDDESSKAKIYSRLAINVSNSNFSERKRFSPINLISSLTTYDIDLIIEFFIKSKFELLSCGHIPTQLRNIENTNDGYRIGSIKKLQTLGLVIEQCHQHDSIKYLHPTNSLYDLCENAIGKEKLIPSFINEDTLCDDIDIFIVTYAGHKNNPEVIKNMILNSHDFNDYIVNDTGDGLVKNESGINNVSEKSKKHVDCTYELYEFLSEKYKCIICGPNQYGKNKNHNKIFINCHYESDTGIFNATSTAMGNDGARKHMNINNTINVYTSKPARRNEIRTSNLLNNGECNEVVSDLEYVNKNCCFSGFKNYILVNQETKKDILKSVDTMYTKINSK